MNPYGNEVQGTLRDVMSAFVPSIKPLKRQSQQQSRLLECFRSLFDIDPD